MAAAPRSTDRSECCPSRCGTARPNLFSIDRDRKWCHGGRGDRVAPRGFVDSRALGLEQDDDFGVAADREFEDRSIDLSGLSVGITVNRIQYQPKLVGGRPKPLQPKTVG